MRKENNKYKNKYPYVRLSSDIHFGLDITRSGFDIQSLLNQYMFGYFVISVQISVQIFGSDLDTDSGIGKMPALIKCCECFCPDSFFF